MTRSAVAGSIGPGSFASSLSLTETSLRTAVCEPRRSKCLRSYSPPVPPDSSPSAARDDDDDDDASVSVVVVLILNWGQSARVPLYAVLRFANPHSRTANPHSRTANPHSRFANMVRGIAWMFAHPHSRFAHMVRGIAWMHDPYRRGSIPASTDWIVSQNCSVSAVSRLG